MKRFIAIVTGVGLCLLTLSLSAQEAKQEKPAVDPKAPAVKKTPEVKTAPADKDKPAPSVKSEKPKKDDGKKVPEKSDKNGKKAEGNNPFNLPNLPSLPSKKPKAQTPVKPDSILLNRFPPSMTGEEILNNATDIKMGAKSIFDLDTVIASCQEAEKRGLSDDYKEFCRQLLISTRLQRGLYLYRALTSGDNVNLKWHDPKMDQFKKRMTDDLTVAIADSPEQATAQLALGRIHMLNGQKNEAIKSLDLAIKYAEEEPTVYAEALRYRGELEEEPVRQLEYFEKAQKKNPDDPKLLSAMTSFWLRAKNYDQAMKLIDQQLKKDATDKDTLKSKAKALAGLGKFDEAEKLFSTLVPNTTPDILELVEKGQFLAAIHKTKEAIDLFTQLITRGNNAPGIYYFRALMYLQDKQYDKALADIDRSLKIDSKFNDALQLKGVIFLQQEKFDDAIRVFKVLGLRNPSDSATTQLAYALAKKGDYDQAVKVLNEALASRKDNVELLRCRGDIELMFGKWKETIATYQQILKLRPNDSGVLNNYSWLLSTSTDDSVRNGKLALTYAEKASKLTWNGEAHILSTLAAAYAELGNFEKAKEWSAKAVVLAEREKHDRLDDLKKELESYKQKKPWREVPEMLRKK